MTAASSSSPERAAVSVARTHWPSPPKGACGGQRHRGGPRRFTGQRRQRRPERGGRDHRRRREAVADGSNVADWDQAAGLIQTAVETFGGLDVLVNNAGIVRDRMIANTSEEEFDAVIAVHLKGHFATMRHAAAYWRGLSKAGKAVDGRIINTSSGAGLQGSVGQGNYSAAKAGIATLTLVGAAEMGRYGVTVNAIAPSARTRMTETVFAEMMATQDQDFDAMAPENVSPLVVWLGSAEARDVTGKVFEVEGGKIRVAEGWAHGPQIDKGARWDPAELGPVVADLLGKARPPVPVYGA
ncbi:short chain dehydrogenase [Mycobacterium avium subsp. avium 2285 (R)]|nr:short chain dehydrogenase [Mycobacterium avium subsp. avium 2285 (R)]